MKESRQRETGEEGGRVNDSEGKQRGRNSGVEQTNRDFQMKVGREQRQKRIMIWKDCVCVCLCVCARHRDES